MKTRKLSPLTYPAAGLSLASLAWTTWSLVDLLGTGLIGVTVAAGADVVWASVIIAEARRLRVTGKAWAVPLVGWLALLAVAGLLVWHGIDRDAAAMAVAGPLLPLGAKVVWVLALADMRNPADLTDDERAVLARMERGMTFEEEQHRIEMRRRAMAAELHMAEVSVDFDIEIMRQDKTRELGRRQPLALTARPALEAPRAPSPELPQKKSRRQPPAAPDGPTGEPVDDVAALFEGAHAPVVYFLRNGSRVKIGTSQNLKRRIGSLSLRPDDVIRVEHGDQQYERSLHRRFAELRAGDTEWFELRGTLATYVGAQPDEPVEPSAHLVSEPEAQPDEPETPAASIVLASSQAAPPEPTAHPTEPFGFSAHLSAQSAQRAAAVAQVAELLAQDPGLTSGQVAETLSVSPATAKRYLREARQGRP